MDFSVLLSLYAREKSYALNACLESIWFKQNIKPTEIILVQDGPIGTQLIKVVKYWQNQIGDVLKVIALPDNIGLGRALNEGLKHCSYEWVFRMDTDDICLPNRFEKQIQYINNNPEIVILGGQISEFNKKPLCTRQK